MKAVILAGGMGTRIREEGSIRPKPLVEVGGMPILWHIMKIYSHFGIDEFIICLGYKGYMIKEYFSNYALHMSDVTFDMSSGRCRVHSNKSENWRVTLVDTGEDAMTGARIAKIRSYVQDDDAFCLTYGDGVSDLNIADSIRFHKVSGRLALVTAVRPPPRFGTLELGAEGEVLNFAEKPTGDGAWINGGFFVLNPGIFDFIPEGEGVVWEREPLEALARAGQLMSYRHDGFWQPMDTVRDRDNLDGLWRSGKAPWKLWQ
ncbi:MAG: glucose-1-phosphate cytidylyltransferase [Bacteroidales bacterium]